MKKVFGSLLCVAAIGLMFGHIVGQKSDTPAHNAQDWALIGVLLAVGIPLSSGKKKSEGTKEK
jgi:uncharacterized membrane protein YbjE (DUF340 family)